jgi:hypothetical protein
MAAITPLPAAWAAAKAVIGSIIYQPFPTLSNIQPD